VVMPPRAVRAARAILARSASRTCERDAPYLVKRSERSAGLEGGRCEPHWQPLAHLQGGTPGWKTRRTGRLESLPYTAAGTVIRVKAAEGEKVGKLASEARSASRTCECDAPYLEPRRGRGNCGQFWPWEEVRRHWR
jgi:hypothetical protein